MRINIECVCVCVRAHTHTPMVCVHQEKTCEKFIPYGMSSYPVQKWYDFIPSNCHFTPKKNYLIPLGMSSYQQLSFHTIQICHHTVGTVRARPREHESVPCGHESQLYVYTTRERERERDTSLTSHINTSPRSVYTRA